MPPASRHSLGLAVLLVTLAPGSAPAQGHVAPLTISGAATDFDFLIGDWDIDVESRAPGRPPRYRGRWTAARTFDGRLIVDEFRILDDSGVVRHLSVTYRTFNRSSGRWLLRWLNLDNNSWQEAEAAGAGGEVHVRQWSTLPNGREGVLRIRYQDITPNGFLWRMDRSVDGGATWDDDVQVIRARRRAAAQP